MFIIVHLTGFAQEPGIVLGHPAAQHTVEDIVDQGVSSTSSVGTGDPSSRKGTTVSDKGCAATGTISSLSRSEKEQYSVALVKENQSERRKGIQKAFWLRMSQCILCKRTGHL